MFGLDAGGGPLASNVVRNLVPVTNGVFNVSLDFGAAVFTGAARWLEISVRTNGAGALVILAPRTPLLPTPYAIFAGSAGGVANGTVTANQLNTAIAPTSGQFLSYNGGNLAWTAPGVAVGNIWSALSGNAYYIAGNVGVGTKIPATKLTVLTTPNNYGFEHTDGTIRMGTFLGGSAGGGLARHAQQSQAQFLRERWFLQHDGGYERQCGHRDTRPKTPPEHRRRSGLDRARLGGGR